MGLARGSPLSFSHLSSAYRWLAPITGILHHRPLDYRPDEVRDGQAVAGERRVLYLREGADGLFCEVQVADGYFSPRYAVHGRGSIALAVFTRSGIAVQLLRPAEVAAMMDDGRLTASQVKLGERDSILVHEPVVGREVVASIEIRAGYCHFGRLELKQKQRNTLYYGEMAEAMPQLLPGLQLAVVKYLG